MLTVISAAEQTRLTTLEALKSELVITGTDEDEYLTTLLDRVSAAIVGYLDVPPAQDGTRSLGRETLVETIRLDGSRARLFLTRVPVSSVASIEADGEVMAPSDYELDAIAGFLTRLADDALSVWSERKIVVAYTAGWLMPGETGRNLPIEIEDAALELIKGVRFSRSRDPALRSENILEGLYSYTLFDSFKTEGTIPPPVAAKLDPYRYPPAI